MSQGQAKCDYKHGWVLSPSEAIKIQESLRSKVLISPLSDKNINLIAGVDVGLPRGRNFARAAIAILSYPMMELIEQATAELPVTFPYIPGMLSFRELPVILAALEQLQNHPDVYIVDGHGYAHPRRFGLACHLGIWLDQPTIGCGKSILVGDSMELKNAAGSLAPLRDGEETIGAALRTRKGIKPVYVSVGHRVDIQSAIQITLRCGRGFRLPEPIRWAHRLASAKS
jgi:deoxyribonuclease V